MHKSAGQQVIDLFNELKTGRHYGVFIDDTGSPGLRTPGLHSERKSWVAVLIRPRQVLDVLRQLPEAIEALKEIGVHQPEFHFAEIWAARGPFRELTYDARIGIFQFMANIFSIYNFRVLVQTFDPENSADVQRRADFPKTLGPLKFDDHADLALIFSLLRVRFCLRHIDKDATACVYVDEGRLSAGSQFVVPGLAPQFCGGTVEFQSSKVMTPLQLADFAAFAMNRWQVLRVKEQLSNADKELLKILTPVASCFENLDTLQIEDLDGLVRLRDAMH
jgi:hypothetical protein